MKKQLSIFYERSGGYRVVPVHGAWGSVTPQGDVVADLYVERISTPEEVTLEVEEGGRAREVEKHGQRHVRESQVGIALRPEVAYALGQWLIAKAKQAGFVVPAEKERH